MEEKEKLLKRNYLMPETLLKDLEYYSQRTKLSMSDIVRVSVRVYLWDHPLKIDR